MQPLVSIITPSYNQVKYLEATLNSVLRQDYPNLEYIVVDGGSDDGSLAIIKEYADEFSWWVSEQDQGQAAAINKGFHKATGDILAWLNSDDLYLPHVISKAVKVFEDNPQVGMIYGNAFSADGDGYLLNELRFENWETLDLLQFNMICQPAVFMRKQVLENVGYLDTSYHFFLDHQLWIRIARESQLLHIPDYWAVSRYHPEAKNVTMASKCSEEVWRIIDWAGNQPDLADMMADNHSKIWAGAYQISARYLLDGGKPFQAFRNYFQAARTWPPSLKDFWHRMLFAALSIVGLGFLGDWYYRWKYNRPKNQKLNRSYENWSGIQ